MRAVAAAAPFLLPLAASVCLAATIHVPGDQPTIQAAVDAASDGDTVLLADGTYQGLGNRDVTVIGKQIVIRSASDDPHVCVIDPQGTAEEYHRAFELHHLPLGPDTEIRSLTIIGGHVGGPVAEARGGAIWSGSSQPLIKNVRFVSNVASEGGAVYATEGSARFVDCEFVGNRSVESGPGAFGWGGAVFLDIGVEGSFVRCRFADNQSQASGGAITAWSESPLSLLGCEFEGNRTVRLSAGAVGVSGPASITDCRFVGNSSDEGGALVASGGLDLVGSTFSGNEALYSGGAVRVVGSEPVTIMDCDFFGNSSTTLGRGGGLHVNTEGPVAVDRCRFFSNQAPWSGGAVALGFDTTGEIRESLFVGNVTAGAGGALLVRSASFLVEQCILAGNAATRGGGIEFRPHSEVPNPELLVRNTVIAFGEAGGAVSCFYPGATIACTDLFGNAGGDGLCGTDGGGNFSADPLFCDPDGGDFTLSSQSPCLPGNHPYGADCGLIGAFGQGCGPVSIEELSWGRIKGMYRDGGR